MRKVNDILKEFEGLAEEHGDDEFVKETMYISGEGDTDNSLAVFVKADAMKATLEKYLKRADDIATKAKSLLKVSRAKRILGISIRALPILVTLSIWFNLFLDPDSSRTKSLLFVTGVCLAMTWPARRLITPPLQRYYKMLGGAVLQFKLVFGKQMAWPLWKTLDDIENHKEEEK